MFYLLCLASASVSVSSFIAVSRHDRVLATAHVHNDAKRTIFLFSVFFVKKNIFRFHFVLILLFVFQKNDIVTYIY